MQHLEGSGTPVLHIGRTVLKRLSIIDRGGIGCFWTQSTLNLGILFKRGSKITMKITAM